MTAYRRHLWASRVPKARISTSSVNSVVQLIERHSQMKDSLRLYEDFFEWTTLRVLGTRYSHVATEPLSLGDWGTLPHFFQTSPLVRLHSGRWCPPRLQLKLWDSSRWRHPFRCGSAHVAVYGTKAVPVPATCRTQRKQSAAAGHRPLPFTKGRPFKIPTKSVDMRHDPSRPLCANVKHLTCKCIASGTRTTSPIRNSLHVQTPTSLNCTSPYVHQEALTRQ